MNLTLPSEHEPASYERRAWEVKSSAARPQKSRLRPTQVDTAGKMVCAFVIMFWVLGMVWDFHIALSCIAITGLLFLAMGVVTPHWGAFGVAMLCSADPLFRQYILSGGLLRWNTMNYFLLAYCVLYAPFILRRREATLWSLLALLGFLTLEIAWSPGRMSGAYHLLNLNAAVGIFIVLVRANRRPESLYWMGIIAGLNAAMAGMVYFLTVAESQRMDGNAFSYLPLAGVFGVCIGMHVGVTRGRALAPLLVLCSVCLVWLILSASRGGIITCIPCVLFLIARLPHVSQRVAYVGVGCAVVLSIVAFFPEMTEATLRRFQKLGNDEVSISARTSGRSDLAYGAWKIFQKNPLGIGTGGFSKYWARVSVDESDRLSGYARGREQTCHSGWMKTLCENGVPGFLLLANFVLSFVISTWGSREPGRFAFALLVTTTLTLSFISTEFAGKSTWMLASAAIVLLSSARSFTSTQYRPYSDVRFA